MRRSLRLRNILLWVFVCSGAVVLVEPSPYEVMFVLAGGLFFATGLKLNALLLRPPPSAPRFNLGGVIGLYPLHRCVRPSVMFVIISFYMMFNAAFFAALMGDDDGTIQHHSLRLYRRRMDRRAGRIIGYFQIAGLGDLFTRYSRASGTFKDPNVLGTFLVFPIVCLGPGLVSAPRWRQQDIHSDVSAPAGAVPHLLRGSWGIRWLRSPRCCCFIS